MMHIRRLLLTVLVFTIIAATTIQAQDTIASNLETKAVETTLKSFFDALANFDYQEMRDLTSADFTLIENGPVWSLDDLIARAKQGEKNGASLSYEFSNMKTTVKGSSAWMTYSNNGVMTMGEKETEYHWTECAVFQKMKDGWRIVLLHSTMNEPESDDGEE